MTCCAYGWQLLGMGMYVKCVEQYRMSNILFNQVSVELLEDWSMWYGNILDSPIFSCSVHDLLHKFWESGLSVLVATLIFWIAFPWVFWSHSNHESCQFLWQLSIHYRQLSPNTTQQVGLEQLSICATPTGFAHLRFIPTVRLSS
jgi:hypothetical protein